MATYTAKQREALKIIQASVETQGIAPTLEEIAYEMGGISRVSVLEHLRALEKKGAIRRKARQSRAIEILDQDYAPARGIPLAGTIAAGKPILEVEDREEVNLDEYLSLDDGCFLLRVQGDSMIEDHIMDGDLVLVQGSRTADDGDTVVAVVDGETTLKRFYREGKNVRLQPANEALDPFVYPASKVQLRGVLRGVIRRT
jgi:repressor LexA